MHEDNSNENEHENNTFDVIDKQILPRYQRSKCIWTTEELIEELSGEVLFLKIFFSFSFCLFVCFLICYKRLVLNRNFTTIKTVCV